MSNAVMPLSDYVDVCDKIRKKTNSTDKIKSGDLAAKVDEVYEAGKASGGGDSYYDEFWDEYQANGNRTICDSMFAGNSWNSNTFKPKYTIKPARAQHMFLLTSISGDLVELCEKQGITLDFSNCTLFNNLMVNAMGITRIGVIDARKQTDSGGMFNNMRSLVTFDKYIVSETTPYYSYAFQNAEKLENLTVEGVIAQNNFNVQWSTKLSKSSIKSIINCLSTTTSGLTVTLSRIAIDNAFETSSGLADGSTSQEWLNLVATKTNWTISLV